jgi:hypothetical protein
MALRFDAVTFWYNRRGPRRTPPTRVFDVRRGLLAAVVLFAVAACSQPEGLASRDAVVQAYLDGLAQRDAAAITKLVSATVDARQDIAAALGRYGGLRFADKTTTYLDELGGIYVIATVVGSGADDSLRHEVKVPVARVNGRYFLALGHAGPSGSDGANPGSPSP